ILILLTGCGKVDQARDMDFNGNMNLRSPADERDRIEIESGVATAVVAMYIRDVGRRPISPPSTNLIFALWPDGTSSCNLKHNGVHPKQFKMSSDNIRGFTERLQSIGFFNEDIRREWYGFDSPYVVIQANLNRATSTLRSWHPLYNSKTNMVVIDGFIVPVSPGEKRYPLAESSLSYRKFIRLWEETIKLLINTCEAHK
ncbi:MAG: hypothetical protein AB1813_00400, partial [Verrucomicrobiota bacterium]